MSILTYPRSKAVLTAGMVISAGLFFSACSQHTKAIPAWGGEVRTSTGNITPAYRPVEPNVEVMPASVATINRGRTTFTQGCTGSYSVRDGRSNRYISSGRAFNSGNGLIALDARGRQTRAISSSPSLSVIFLPDCNCKTDGDQSGSVSSTHQFAAAPSVASCSAN